MVGSVMARGADLGVVEDRSFLISDFRLQNGTVMPQAKIAYETYGRLAADGKNAVLITHGYTSSHHAAGRNPANGNQPGWWEGDRYRQALCRLLEHARLVLWLDQRREHQSRHR